MFTTAPPTRSRPIAPIPLAIGIACLITLAIANLPPYAPEMSYEARTTVLGTLTLHGQAGFLLIGAALLAWGVSGARLPIRFTRHRVRRADAIFGVPTNDARADVGTNMNASGNTKTDAIIGIPTKSLVDTLALAAVLVLALALRLHERETVLPVLIDEYNFVAAVTRASDDRTLRLLVPISAWAPYTWLYTTLQVTTTDLYGHTLSALRGASLVLCLMQIAVTYALARTLCGRGVGLLAALALAVLAPHIHYSNTAYSPHPGDTLFGLLTMLFAARALRDRRPLDWALAGACLGLTQYWYEAGRLFFPILIAAWLITRLALRTESLRALLPGVARLAITAVIVGAPMYLTLTAIGHTLTYRFDSENVLQEFWGARLADGLDAADVLAVGERVTKPFLFYFALPETPGVPYYQGDEPLIARAFAPVFLIGLIALVLRPRAPAWVLVLWIGGVALANGLFIRDPMVSTRYGGVVPALAIALAVGADQIAAWTGALARRIGSRVDRRAVGRFAVGLGLIAAFGAINVEGYFNCTVPDLLGELRRFVLQRDLFDVGLRAARLPYGTQVYIVDVTQPDMMDVDMLMAYQTFLQHRTPRTIQPIDIMDTAFTGDFDYAFFVPAGDAEALRTVYTRFPGATPIRYTTSEIAPHETYVLIHVPRFTDRAPAPAERFPSETAATVSPP